MKRHARVSVERLVSGPGLQNLYAAVCAVEGTAPNMDTPAAITAGAKLGADAACRRAVELLCAILGSYAGDVALMVGAWDGVYLGGGLTGTLLPWIQLGQFRRRFEGKGRFSSLMQTIPTFAIAHAQPGLLGAAACALDPTSALIELPGLERLHDAAVRRIVEAIAAFTWGSIPISCRSGRLVVLRSQAGRTRPRPYEQKNDQSRQRQTDDHGRGPAGRGLDQNRVPGHQQGAERTRGIARTGEAGGNDARVPAQPLGRAA